MSTTQHSLCWLILISLSQGTQHSSDGRASGTSERAIFTLCTTCSQHSTVISGWSSSLRKDDRAKSTASTKSFARRLNALTGQDNQLDPLLAELCWRIRENTGRCLKPCARTSVQPAQHFFPDHDIRKSSRTSIETRVRLILSP